MKSSSGEHYLGLDHLRAIAAFLVVSFHFCHQNDSGYLQHTQAPSFFPLAILDQGHTGVALFMTLSGYLFSKLLEGRDFSFKLFLFNRGLRLLPLLIVVVLINLIGRVLLGLPLEEFILDLIKGPLLPTLPNGGWSITVEMQFYIFLPLLLLALTKDLRWASAIITFAMLVRLLVFLENVDLSHSAYYTIVGRIDQFVLGMAAARCRGFMVNKTWLAAGVFLSFGLFYWWFDGLGGKDNSPAWVNILWIVIPTIEGASYATLIAYYDRNFRPENRGVSWFLGKAGQYSYSIYLLHFFFANEVAKFIHQNIIPISNFYEAQILAAVFFCFMMILGLVSFTLIESPFLKLRRKYIFPAASAPVSQESFAYKAAQSV